MHEAMNHEPRVEAQSITPKEDDDMEDEVVSGSKASDFP